MRSLLTSSLTLSKSESSDWRSLTQQTCLVHALPTNMGMWQAMVGWHTQLPHDGLGLHDANKIGDPYLTMK
jgi:hypothetical protein